MKKRVLTALLAVIMVISLGTVSALAEGPTEVGTFDDLTTALAAGGEIKLTADIELTGGDNGTGSVVVPANVTVRLDLNGYKIKAVSSDTPATYAVDVSEGAGLTICDSSPAGSGTIVQENKSYGSLIRCGVHIQGNASVTLESGSIYTAGITAVGIYGDGGSFVMNGGKVETALGGNWYEIGTNSDNVTYSASIIVKQGKLVNVSHTAAQKYVAEGSVLVRTAKVGSYGNNGNYEVTTTAPANFNVSYGGKYYDQFGTIEDVSVGDYGNYFDDNETVEIIVNAAGSGSVMGTLASGTVHYVLNPDATIYYEQYKNDFGFTITRVITLNEGATVIVSGEGEFEPNVVKPSDTNVIDMSVSEGTTTYTSIAPRECFKVGENKFNTLKDALTAAKSGDGTITMLKDYTASAADESITIGTKDKITLDLGGHTLYMNSVQQIVDDTNSSLSRLTTIFNQGNLTIRNGNLSITSAVKEAINGIVNAEGAVLTVEPTANLYSRGNIYEGSYVIVNLGGTVNTAGTINGNGNNGIVTYGGVLNITGGSVKGTGSSMSAAIDIFSRNYDSTSAGAEVSISGGDIYGATFALSTNNVKSSNSSLTITGGSISSQLTTIYWPSAGTLTIGTEGSQTGPTISSAEGSAVEIASGTLNVYGGTLQGGTAMTAADQTKVDAELVNEFRTHSGASNAGDAITVAANRAGGYAESPLNVNIKGGTLVSSQNYGVRYMDCNLSNTGAEQLEQIISVDVSGGSVSGTLGAVEASFVEPADQRFISGGEFSSSVSEYVEPGRDFEANNNGTYSYYISREEAEKHGEVSYVGADGVTVTFKDGSSVSKVYYEKNATVILPNASRSGYIFLGWRSGDKTFSAGERVVVSADVTFTAVWGNLPDTAGTYPITVADPANGAVSVSLPNASEGAVITVTAKPDEGYVLAYVTVDGQRISGSSFTMPGHAVTVSAVFVRAGLPFTDVAYGDWFYDEVAYVYANGLMEGVSDTAFEPGGGMTRAMVWAILARIDGVTVTGSNWAETARSWAMAKGISDGENASAPVTREQLVTMLYRYAGEPVVSGSLTGWADAASVSGWAGSAMTWAVNRGIITGATESTLAPADGATRAQCAAILMRYIEA